MCFIQFHVLCFHNYARVCACLSCCLCVFIMFVYIMLFVYVYHVRVYHVRVYHVVCARLSCCLCVFIMLLRPYFLRFRLKKSFLEIDNIAEYIININLVTRCVLKNFHINKCTTINNSVYLHVIVGQKFKSLTVR